MPHRLARKLRTIRRHLTQGRCPLCRRMMTLYLSEERLDWSRSCYWCSLQYGWRRHTFIMRHGVCRIVYTVETPQLEKGEMARHFAHILLDVSKSFSYRHALQCRKKEKA